jgi:hypothetical protein
MGFQVLMAASIKMTAFWNIAPCSLIEVNRCFRGLYRFHYLGDEYALMMEAVCTSETSVYFNEIT